MSVIDAAVWPEVRRPDLLRDIVWWSAAELSSAIRGRVVSCVEVMEAYLDHIDRVNPHVNAIVALRPRAELLAEAEEKDRALAAGEPVGWMHGFPQAVKDLANVRGWPTGMGFFGAGLTAPIAEHDALFVERMRAAGAIFIGRTNTPEFGMGSHTFNAVHGVTRNAFDRSRSAGGSSGGAAVAVALHLLPVADGSDFMGSLRNPPGWNNVVGLRPSFGRVPGFGGDLFTAQGGVEGPIARTVHDLGLLLATMAGYDERSPLSIAEDPAVFARVTEPAPASVRVGWLGDLGGYFAMEPEVLAVTRAAVGRFAGAGAVVCDIDALPSHGSFSGVADLWPTWLTFRHWSNGATLGGLYADPEIRARMKPEARYEIEGAVGTFGAAPAAGAEPTAAVECAVGAVGAARPVGAAEAADETMRAPMTAMEFAAASRRRSDLYEALRGLFAEVDVLAIPTAPCFPFDAALDWPREINGRPMNSYHRWMEVTVLATLTGLPALAVQAGFSAAGLPIGVQLIGRNHGDLELLGIGAAWERAQGAAIRRRPSLLGE